VTAPYVGHRASRADQSLEPGSEWRSLTATIVLFDEIADEFVRRAHSVVWCNVATVDPLGRPRSRILHPYWEGRTGWIATRPTQLKLRHLAANANVSLAYCGDPVKPVYVDGVATWIDDLATRRRVWNLFRDATPPLGYDPGTIFASPEDAGFGLLRITPRRIELGDMTTLQKLVWKEQS
jgi:uncharacterized pyridoxamine 5'-phosphate oxidase family protein